MRLVFGTVQRSVRLDNGKGRGRAFQGGNVRAKKRSAFRILSHRDGHGMSGGGKPGPGIYSDYAIEGVIPEGLIPIGCRFCRNEGFQFCPC